jgi:hypothetical protein
MNSRLIHTLFEMAPLAPIGLICGVHRPSFMIPSIDKDNEVYLTLTKEIKTWSPETRAYWGLNADLEQAEKTAESAAEMVLDETEESFEPAPMHKPLHMINSIQATLPSTYGVVMVMERGGTTYYNRL